MRSLDEIIKLIAEIDEELVAITEKLESENGQTVQQATSTKAEQEGEK